MNAPLTRCVFVLAVAAASGWAAPRPDSDAARWVAAYNARDFGAPGVQRVAIELRNGSQISRRFVVVQAWRADTVAVDSVYCLEEPVAMARTAYFQVERASARDDLGVHLFLPSGRRQVLEVAPTEHDEGLLGSDFSYEDMRRRLPRAGTTYRFGGRAAWRGERAVALEVERSTGHWRRARLWIAEGQPFLLAADYFRPGEAHAFKRLEVNRSRTIDGVRIPELMTMTTENERTTSVYLVNSRVHVATLPGEVFTVGGLPRLCEALASALPR